MKNDIKTITYEEYLNTPLLLNQYNTIVKYHLHNYGCIYIKTINNSTNVMEIEDIEMLRNGFVKYE